MWPNATQNGSTVAMSIGGNALPIDPWNLENTQDVERYDLSVANVVLRVADDSAMGYTDLVPRSVFEVAAADPVRIDWTVDPPPIRGAYVTIAVFDPRDDANDPLPIDPATYPRDTTVQLVVDGNPSPVIIGRLNILGGGGTPTSFLPSGGQFASTSAVLGMVRLVARVAAPGQSGFDPAWLVGSIEFTLVYPDARARGPEIFLNSEANEGTAILTPGGSVGTARVVVADPKGFSLPEHLSHPGQAGSGPIIDLRFERLAPFDPQDPAQFAIRDLVVSDLDGNPLIDERGNDATSYFRLVGLRNES